MNRKLDWKQSNEESNQHSSMRCGDPKVQLNLCSTITTPRGEMNVSHAIIPVPFVEDESFEGGMYGGWIAGKTECVGGSSWDQTVTCEAWDWGWPYMPLLGDSRESMLSGALSKSHHLKGHIPSLGNLPPGCCHSEINP